MRRLLSIALAVLMVFSSVMVGAVSVSAASVGGTSSLIGSVGAGSNVTINGVTGAVGAGSNLGSLNVGSLLRPSLGVTDLPTGSTATGSLGAGATAVVYETVTAPDNAVEITSPEEFAAMDPKGVYVLANDITISASYKTFSGTLYGNGKTVTTTAPLFENLNGATVYDLTIEGEINLPDQDGVGVLASRATTVTVCNVTNNANAVGFKSLGGIVGCLTNSATFLGCVNNGSMTAFRNEVAGIVANLLNDTDPIVVTFRDCVNNGDITNTSTNDSNGAGMLAWAGNSNKNNKTLVLENCLNTGDVITQTRAGGMLGTIYANNVLIENCENTGTIQSVRSNAGGIAAWMVNGNFGGYYVAKDCKNTGAVTGKGDAGGIGGIWNGALMNVVFDNCENDAPIFGGNRAGGILGAQDGSTTLTITNCSNGENGTIAAGNRAGGIVDKAESSVQTKIENCVNKGAVTVYGETATGVDLRAAGIVAYSSGSAGDFIINNCLNEGAVTAQKRAGGIATSLQSAKGAKVTNCTNRGAIVTYGDDSSGVIAYAWVGGGNDLYVDNCVNYGNVTSSANTRLGGVVGMGGATNAYVTNCANYGDVESALGYVGGLICRIDASKELWIENCLNAGVASSGRSHTGGMISRAGDNSVTTIKNCTNTGEITTAEGKNVSSGGMIGYGTNLVTIDACVNEGAVCGGTSNSAGLYASGNVKTLTITNCYNKGAITGNGNHVAGISSNTGTATTYIVKNCVNEGKITAANGSYCGGIVPGLGTTTNATVENCYNAGQVSAKNWAGGIVGAAANDCVQNLTIKNCVNAGAISGDYIGGIMGVSYVEQNIVIDGCINEATGTLSGTASTAGILGHHDGKALTVKNCVNKASVNSTNKYAGGITGEINNATTLTYENCVNEGTVKSAQWAGGISGGIDACSDAYLIKNCLNKGEILGTTYVGGIAGVNYCSATMTVQNCANTAKVTGSSAAGGIVGHQDGTATLTIKDCTNSGTVYCTKKVGGIAAEIYGAALTIDNCLNTGSVTSMVSGTSNHDCGGIIGFYSDQNGDLVINNTKNSGKVSGNGKSRTGGVIGVAYVKSATVTNTVNSGDVETKANGGQVQYLGGLACRIDAFTDIVIRNCVNEGNVSSTRYSAGILTLTGNDWNLDGNRTVLIENCKNTGAIHSSGERCSGIACNTSEHGASIDAFTVRNCENTGKIYGKSGMKSGMVANCSDSTTVFTIENCLNSGELATESASRMGGMISEFMKGASLSVINCKNTGTITSTSTTPSWASMGGMIGFVESVIPALTVKNCENAASAKISGGFTAAGIVGQSKAADVLVENCVNYAPVETIYEIYVYGEGKQNSTNAAGIFGWQERADSKMVVRNCLNEGAIHGVSRSAGIFTYNNNTTDLTVENCTNNGAITSDKYFMGGITAHISNASKVAYKNCINNGPINDPKKPTQVDAGGIIAFFSIGIGKDLFTVDSCVNTAEVHGGRPGGIVGVGLGMTVTNCVNTGKIVSDSNYAGGLVSRLDGVAAFENCINTGSVTSHRQYAAGILAYSTANNLFENCANTGDILLDTYGKSGTCSDNGCHNSTSTFWSDCGGIAGRVDGGDFYNCVNTGDVYGHTKAAGIVGAIQDAGIAGDSANILDSCFVSGTITANCVAYGLDKSNGAGGVYGYINCSGMHPEVLNCVVVADIVLEGTYPESTNLPMAGGIGGYYNGSASVIKNNVFAGTVSSTSGKAFSLIWNQNGSNFTITPNYIVEGAADAVYCHAGTYKYVADYDASLFFKSEDYANASLLTTLGSNFATTDSQIMQKDTVAVYNAAKNLVLPTAGITSTPASTAAPSTAGTTASGADVSVITGAPALNLGVSESAGTDTTVFTGADETKVGLYDSETVVEIGTAEEFLAMKPNGNYVLTADITLPSSYTGIFMGKLDGADFTVTVSNAPVFESLLGATVENLTVAGSIEDTASDYVGALAPYATLSTIVGVTNTATVTASGNAGGLLGLADVYVTVLDSTNDAAVIGGANVGGIIACVNGVTLVSGATNNGAVTATEGIAGGIVALAGTADNSNPMKLHVFEGCLNTGKVTAHRAAVGGILASTGDSATFFACRNDGEVSGELNDAVKGTTCTANECHDSENTLYVYAGGIAGEVLYEGSFYGCVNTGDVTANSRVGGIVGSVGEGGVAGVLGYNEFIGCVSAADILHTGTYSDAKTKAVGGLFGYANATSATKALNVAYCGVAGSVTGVITDATAANVVGAIGGYANSVAIFAKYNYVTAEITAVGGLTSVLPYAPSYDVPSANLVSNLSTGAKGLLYIIDNADLAEIPADEVLDPSADLAETMNGLIGFEGFITDETVPVPVFDPTSISAVLPTSSPISSAEDFANMDPYGNYYLTGDITLTESYKYVFCGVLDGNGYTVTTTAPLFEEIDGARVLDLTIAGDIIGSGFAVGAVANTATSANVYAVTIKANVANSSIDTAKESNRFFVGGVFGKALGSTVITSVLNTGTVKGSSVGGVVGLASGELTIRDSVNTGTVTTYASASTAGGGLIGFGTDGDYVIDNCENYGTVTFLSSTKYTTRAGGLVGFINATKATLTITDSLNAANVLGGDQVGGLVGWAMATVTVTNSANFGNVVSTSNYAAGIVARADYNTYSDASIVHTFRDCTNEGNVYAHRQYAGGMIGYSRNSVSAYNCLNSGYVGADQFTNGNTCEVNKCHATGKADAPNNNTRNISAGGMAGVVRGKGIFEYCVNTGDVKSPMRAAGIAGSVGSDDEGCKKAGHVFKGCVNLGDIYCSGALLNLSDIALGAAGIVSYGWGDVQVTYNTVAGTVVSELGTVSPLCNYANNAACSFKYNAVIAPLTLNGEGRILLTNWYNTNVFTAERVTANFYVEGVEGFFYRDKNNTAGVTLPEDYEFFYETEEVASGDLCDRLNALAGEGTFVQHETLNLPVHNLALAVLDRTIEVEPPVVEPETTVPDDSDTTVGPDDTTVAPDDTTDVPTTDEPTTDAPTTDEPTTDAPTTDEPTTDEPTTDEPTTDAPTTDEPTTDAPTTDDPSAGTTTDDTDDKPSKGCGSVIGASAILIALALIAPAAISLKKKDEE